MVFPIQQPLNHLGSKPWQKALDEEDKMYFKYKANIAILCTANKGGCTVRKMLEKTENFGKPTIQLLLWEQDTKREASSQKCSLTFCRSD